MIRTSTSTVNPLAPNPPPFGIVDGFRAALWAEALKARRSYVAWVASAGFLILPFVGGLFMVILKDPERAQSMGLISMKAQLMGGVADWPSFFDLLLQGTAIGGSMLFAFITAWVFGREFADHTMKELLAVPTPRQSFAAAKLALILVWTIGLAMLSFVIGLLIGLAIGLPGWTPALLLASLRTLLLVTVLVYMLLPFVAFCASAGRGYLPAIGWAFFTLASSQIAVVLGWGDWFPWAVPVLASGQAGADASQVGVHGYALVLLAFVIGAAATLVWWRDADQAR